MFEDSLDDTVVGPQNDDQRDQVVGDAQEQDGDLVGEGLCDVIVRATIKQKHSVIFVSIGDHSLRLSLLPSTHLLILIIDKMSIIQPRKSLLTFLGFRRVRSLRSRPEEPQPIRWTRCS